MRILAIESSTTSAKAMLYDSKDGVVGMLSESYSEGIEQGATGAQDPEAVFGKTAEVARRLAAELSGEAARCGEGCTLDSWTADAFANADALVYVGAAGIAVRAVAPYAGNKASDPAVVAVGVAALHIQCCTVILNGFNMMGNMMTQTMGRTGIASFLALCRQGLFLAPIVLILPMIFGVLGVEMAQSVSDGLTFVVTIPFMRRILHELR